MTAHAKDPRVALNLRIGKPGKQALVVIAEKTAPPGKEPNLSLVARDGLALWCSSFDMLARIANHRTTSTGKPVTPYDVAQAAMRDYAATHDPERQRR